MRFWVAMMSLVVVVGIAAAQDDEEKPTTKKAAPKAKKPAEDKDTVEIDAASDPNPLGKKAADSKDIISKASYGIGAQIGKNLKQAGVDFDLARLKKGLHDALEGKEPELSDEELKEVMAAFDQIARKAMAQKAKTEAAKNSKAGEEFLEANKAKEGVKTLPSGLQYKVLTAGKGASPKASDTVRVHYRGKLTSGKVFDQSYAGEAPTKKDQPAEFQVKGVIKGWTEALLKMKVGDKWQLVIPSELAYGENGAGGVIGPGAVLVFEVELLDILE